MILVVLILAAVTATSGGFIVGVLAGLALARARRDAGGIAPHEALRSLYGANASDLARWGQ